jgi:hypothetical protein
MKVLTTVCVDALALQTAKSKGANISKICSDALILYTDRPLESIKNETISKLETAKKDLDTLIDAQKVVQDTLEQKKTDALNKFINEISDNVILNGHEAQLEYWSCETGKTTNELIDLKTMRGYQKQKEKIDAKAKDTDTTIERLGQDTTV